MTVAPPDLGTYLGTTVDETRAQYLIDRATDLCLSICDPLPAAADAVILDVVARAWSNPTNVQQQTVGPLAASYGAGAGGLWLTRQNKATLRRLNGGGGAFTIDTAPATAPPMPWWELNTWGAGGDVFGGDWDQVP